MEASRSPSIYCVIRSDEGLTLETSVFQSLYGGQFTFINSVDKPNFRVSLPHRRSTTVSSETNPPFTQWLVMLNYARAFSQWETEKYFEWNNIAED